MEGKVVKAKPVSSARPPGYDIDEACYRLCYYYPQYTLHDAYNLRFDIVLGLLDTAMREKARDFAELTNIAAAPHTKKGQGVKKLMNEYKRRMGG